MDEQRELTLKLWSYSLPEPYATQFWNILANRSIDYNEPRLSVPELKKRILAKLQEKHQHDPMAGRIYR